MGRILVKATIAIRSPYMFAATEVSAHGIDKSPLRDSDGYPLIPGDHVRGHLRHAAQSLWGKDSPVVKALFGAPSPDRDNTAANGRADEPERGALIFSDFVGRTCTPGSIRPNKAVLHHRVAMDDESGTAKDGALQVMELAVEPEAVTFFEGEIVLRTNGALGWDTAKTEESLKDLLWLVPAMGAAKSAGFGLLDHDASTFEAEPLVMPAAVQPPPGPVLEVDFEFGQNLLVDIKRKAQNVFEGSEIVPGAAIKGALAEILTDLGVMNDRMMRSLSCLTIGHAFPLSKGKIAGHAVPACICLAKAEDGTLRFGLPLDGHDGDLERLAEIGTPTFPMDWKDKQFEDYGPALGSHYPDLQKQARGQVQIDTKGMAEDAMLFVTTQVVTKGRTWRSRFALNDANSADIGVIFGLLRKGVHGLGRNGTKITASNITASVADSVSAGRIALILRTPAILTSPEDRRSPGEKYHSYFEAVVGKNAIRNFEQMATRKLGGDFYGFRFAKDGRYRHFEITEAGSVFVFDTDETGAEILCRLLASGLPALDGYKPLSNPAADWRHHPMVPQNGFGAIELLDLSALRSALAGMEKHHEQ